MPPNAFIDHEQLKASVHAEDRHFEHVKINPHRHATENVTSLIDINCK